MLVFFKFTQRSIVKHIIEFKELFLEWSILKQEEDFLEGHHSVIAPLVFVLNLLSIDVIES